MVQVEERRIDAPSIVPLAPGFVRPLPGRIWRAGVTSIDAGDARTDVVALGPHRYESAPGPDEQPPSLLVVAVGCGRLTGTTGDEPFSAAPGQALLLDTSRPITAHVEDDVRLLRVLVHRELLKDGSGPEPATTVLSSSPVVQSCTAAASTLLRMCRVQGAADREAVAQTLIGLSLALLAEARHQRRSDPLAGTPQRRREDIEDLVRMRLSDPDLAPTTIATAMGLSVRSVHAAFDGSGTTLAALIRRRRIEAVQRDLEARTVMPRLAELALAHGFASSDQLTRSFQSVTGTGLRSWFERRGDA